MKFHIHMYYYFYSMQIGTNKYTAAQKAVIELRCVHLVADGHAGYCRIKSGLLSDPSLWQDLARYCLEGFKTIT